MNKFIKYQVWEDFWCFKPSTQIDVSLLEKLNYFSWFKDKKDEIKIRLESLENAQEPTIAQIRTLKFVVENQSVILKSIYDYYENVILPVYKDAIDIDENDIAHNQSQLSIVFGITGIEIPVLEESDSVYYLIQFDFKYDAEHGLYILFEGSTPIDFFAEGEKSYDAISIYQEGLKNINGKPLKVNLYQLNGTTVFQEHYYFDEPIEFRLAKGTYRTFITCNQAQLCRNFYVPNDLQKFSLKQLLTMKY
jgi:hypothetical protein